MTRLTVPHPGPSKPASVALSELAIAAGAAGQSVTLCYDGFPATVLCHLWRYCSRYAGLSAVRHVRTQSDIRTLTECVSAVRLVLIHVPRLRNATSWAIQMTPTAAEGRHRLPAQFCWGGLNDVDDDPGATLVLRGDGDETAAVARWLSMMQPDAPNWACISAAQTVVAEPILDRILSPCGMESATLHRLRDRQVLQALVVGASVLRTLGQGAEQLSELAMGTEDYEHVRGLLRTRLVAAADEVCDPLAADMVGRANVYMGVKFGGYSDSSNPLCEGNGGDPGIRPSHELITRREIADLGNVRSRLVRRLIEFLRRRPDGYERFLAMGVARRPPNRNAWRTLDADDLTAYLRPWSAKQVRSHFEQLHRVGMISAERDHGNGPWRYALPEELNGQHSVFRGLPTAQELLGRAQAR